MGKTVGSTISDLVQAFRANLRPDPTRDATGEKAAILTRQIKAYKNSNPPPNHQAALPLIVWNAINNNHNTIKDSAIGSLIIGALFFAMRSCKYSHTDKNESKKTKLLCLRNIQFFNKSTDGYLQEVPHDSNLTTLQSSDCVTITFENQKNGQKDATITQHKTPANRICPVKAWANTIHRILSYEGTDSNTEVNTFKINGKLVKFTSKQICQHIKSTVKTIGSSRLGIDIKRVGTHSLRTSAAMLLYLANVWTSTIMLLGWWHSDAFLLYLQRQVKEFTEGVTHQMTSQPDIFCNIPSQPIEDLPNRHHAQRDDPMTSNIDSTASTARFNGLALWINTSQFNPNHIPNMHIWGWESNQQVATT